METAPRLPTTFSEKRATATGGARKEGDEEAALLDEALAALGACSRRTSIESRRSRPGRSARSGPSGTTTRSSCLGRSPSSEKRSTRPCRTRASRSTTSHCTSSRTGRATRGLRGPCARAGALAFGKDGRAGRPAARGPARRRGDHVEPNGGPRGGRDRLQRRRRRGLGGAARGRRRATPVERGGAVGHTPFMLSHNRNGSATCRMPVHKAMTATRYG